jgi:hypothetical protein
MVDEKATAATGATPDPSATLAEQPADAQPATGDAAPQTDTPEDEQLGPAGVKAYEAEKTARREAEKRAREFAKDKAKLEQRLQEIADKDLDEQTKKDRRLSELEAERTVLLQERQRTMVTMEVNRLQPKMGLVDVDAASRLLDWEQIEYGDDGKPSNVEDLLRGLLKDKPYLGGQRPIPSGTINPAGGTTGALPPRLTAEELEAAKTYGMTPERYAALRSVRTIDDWAATRRSGDAKA